MSERTPSAHSMTVEHVEDIAGELFKLRQWKAEAVKTISKLEGENAELTRQAESATNSGLRDAEKLSLARVELASISVAMDHLRARVRTLESEKADMEAGRAAMSEEWAKSERLQDLRIDVLRSALRGAIDAI